MTDRVLIASPVRQDPEILRAFLEGLVRLKTEDFEPTYCFVDDNDDAESSSLLDAFLAARPGVRVRLQDRPERYVRDENTHHWRKSLLDRVATIKNYLLTLAREDNFSALFLVDSDIVLHPQTLAHLIALNKPVVSEVFWTRWQPRSQAMPQTWLMDHYTMFRCEPGESLAAAEIDRRIRHFLHQMRDGGCHPVGGLGACTLISRGALGSGLSFSPIPNISFWGEDRAFCIRAAAVGVELWADTRYPPLHLYRKDDLRRLPGFWERVNRDFDTNPHLTLTIAVRDVDRSGLIATLRQHRNIVDQVNLIVDAGVVLNKEEIAECLDGVACSVFRPSQPIGSDSYVLRRLAWELTVNGNPDWVLVLDAGERVDDAVQSALRPLLHAPGAQVLRLPIRRHADRHPSRPEYVAALTRYTPDFAYEWDERVAADRRLPDNVDDLPQKVVTGTEAGPDRCAFSTQVTRSPAVAAAA